MPKQTEDNTELILNKIDDLKEFYEKEIDHLKEFYTESRLDMKEDVEGIKQSNKDVSEKMDEYILNHYSFHKREKKRFFRWMIIGGVVILGLVFSGFGGILFPYIVKLIKLFWVL